MTSSGFSAGTAVQNPNLYVFVDVRKSVKYLATARKDAHLRSSARIEVTMHYVLQNITIKTLTTTKPSIFKVTLEK